jgi:hypothetical protein
VGQPHNETTHRSAAPLPCGPMIAFPDWACRHRQR